MKKRSVGMAIFLLVVMFIVFATYSIGWIRGKSFNTSSTYTAPARVAEVDESTGWVTFIDWNGEAWCVRDDGYVIDQLVIITFNDNHTESIYDDSIVDIDYTVDIEEVD